MKLIFLEVVHQALYSGKVWGNRFFLFCIRLVGPYSKPFLQAKSLPEGLTKPLTHALTSTLGVSGSDRGLQFSI